MAKTRSRKRLNPDSFKIADWRELFDLYPNQWIAIAVDEITLGAGTTAGRLIARGKEDAPVVAKLKEFRAANPGQQTGLYYTGRAWWPWMDVL
jgi:hypothetical protein